MKKTFRSYTGSPGANHLTSIPIFQPLCRNLDRDLVSKIKKIFEQFNEDKIKAYRKSGYTTIRLRKLSEYNYLLDLADNIEHLEKLLKKMS